MGFKEDVEADIGEVFFNSEEFGSLHEIDGEEITVVVASNERNDTAKRENEKDMWKDEIQKESILIFVKEKDMKRKLSVNSAIRYDGRPFFVNAINKQGGVWKLLLGRYQV